MYSSAQGHNEIEKMGGSGVCAIFFKHRSNSQVTLKSGLHHHQISFGIRDIFEDRNSLVIALPRRSRLVLGS